LTSCRYHLLAKRVMVSGARQVVPPENGQCVINLSTINTITAAAAAAVTSLMRTQRAFCSKATASADWCR